MAMLEPELAVLDETDSGLDIDALRIVANGVQAVRAERGSLGVLLVTHYTRILELLHPDVVHVLVDGRIVEQRWTGVGGPARGRGLRAVAEVTVTKSGVNRTGVAPGVAHTDRPAPSGLRQAQGRLPVAEPHRARTSARLSGLGFVVSASAEPYSMPWTAYYETTHANVHRGVYAIAEEADRLYDAARMAVGRFIGAPDPEHEVIFTKNATEAINLVAATWGRANLAAGDVVLLTDMEHHANIVPWLMLAEERGIELRWIGIGDDYRLDLSDLDRLLDGVKLVGLHRHVERARDHHALRPIAEAAHRAGALVLADGAQSVPHLPTDVAPARL